MCNYLHKDSKPVSKSGTGYKLFEVVSGELRPLVMYSTPYKTRSKKGWIHWGKGCRGDGFCFFLDKTKATDALKKWGYPHETVVQKIEYKGGVGEHEEGGFIGGHSTTIALCKSFRVI